MKSKIILITGSTDGIGYQTAYELLKLGHTIILHGRNEEKTFLSKEKLSSAFEGANIHYVSGDLSSLTQVETISEKVLNQFNKIDVLINNAGIYSNHFSLSKEGFELTFAVNHLAHFHLTNQLLPLVKKSDNGRIINVSSVAHKRGKLELENINNQNTFSPYGSYAQSKLANVLFSNLLADKLNGTKITSNSLHPGVISTKLLKKGFGMSGAPLETGAATSVYLADSENLVNTNGKYFDNCKEEITSPLAVDKTLQHELWEFSEKATGKSFNI